MKPCKAVLTLFAALALAPAAAFCSASALGRSAALNRLVTPNGDGRNDTFIFRCFNPRDAAVDAKIYDLSGREVAQMRLKQRSIGTPPSPSTSGEFYDLEWDPNLGAKSPGGVYVYQVRAEEKVYKGTVVIIR
ncbi:MAG: gliding motility-associated C-terminal domain-containing protein [Elusimicrobiales bacterium]